MLSRKWAAFVRLKGESVVDSDRDIVKEFTRVAQELERVGIEYSMVVSVDRGPIRQYPSRTGGLQSLASGVEATSSEARPEGD